MSWFYFFHSRLWPCNCDYPISMFEGLIIGVPELTFALPSSYLGCLMDFLGLGWHKMTSRPNVSSLPDDRASEPSCHPEPRTYIMFKKVYYYHLLYYILLYQNNNNVACGVQLKICQNPELINFTLKFISDFFSVMIVSLYSIFTI